MTEKDEGSSAPKTALVVDEGTASALREVARGIATRRRLVGQAADVAAAMFAAGAQAGVPMPNLRVRRGPSGGPLPRHQGKRETERRRRQMERGK